MIYVVDVLTYAAIMVIATHGYMLIKGLGGLLHLGHAVFFGLGAYAAAIASQTFLPAGAYPISLLCGAIAAAAGAGLIGWPALKDRARYFMIITFSMQLIFITIVINLGITGGPDGISGIPKVGFGPWVLTSRPVNLGVIELSASSMNLLVALLLMGASFLFCRRIIDSPYGRLVRATREDDLAVEAYGRSATNVRLSIFAIGAALTGIAGAAFAHYFNYIGPSQFELELVILFLIMLILGGQYSIVGATIGVFVTMALLEGLRFGLEHYALISTDAVAHVRKGIFSLILVLVLIVKPSGLIRERFSNYRRPAPEPEADKPAQAISLVVSEPAERNASLKPAALSCKDLHKSFGGLVAVNGVDLSLMEGKITAIIGPNGAGKTTVFNMLSGFVAPTKGEVTFKGKNIVGLAPPEIARLGIARTFQDVRIWPRLTAIENVLASLKDQPGENAIRLFAQPRVSDRKEAENIGYAWHLMERFRLSEKANQLAGELSYAQRKMLALARLRAYDPSIMLLDEPTSGVDPKRLGEFFDQIRGFAESEHRTICMIEHNMTVVRELADWVLFIDEGRVVAQGTSAEVLGNRTLMSAYLGKREAESV
jgi:ABC-type branched-subunit amino acid transport system ATPase component/ABC-type branched-subunit amino acid transport system permease subunit